MKARAGFEGSWIGFVALRYVSRGQKNSPSPVFSVLGIATGVLALIVIIAVMNGFQLGFIESILEISSGHLRLEGLPPETPVHSELSDRLRDIPALVSVLPFKEYNLLLRGNNSNPRGALVRALPPDAPYLDPGLAGRLDFEGGFFDLHDQRSIILGAELARHLFVWVGDELSLLSLSGAFASDPEGEIPVYRVSGIFRSGYYEYDLGWAFVNIEAAPDLSQEELPLVLGIKLRNRWQAERAMEDVRRVLADMNLEDLRLSSWREYNRAFFGALRTEKLMMFILVGLIFIVVGLNIYQAQRRFVLERREEIGLLRALGASDSAVRLIFVWDGIIIGLAGASLGLGLGLLIAFNIASVFSFLEGVVNFLFLIVNEISWYFGPGAGYREFAVFSPQIFYLKEIPSRIIPLEVLMIFLFGFLSALLAAWFASAKVSQSRPAEVLRYE